MCVCVLSAGLDADLLAVIPAFSRHPSLKHLMLGKNFNIKGRYGPRGEPAVQMVGEDDTNDECFPLLSAPSGCWMKFCRNWFIWCKRKSVWVGLHNILCTHAHTHTNPPWCFAQMRLHTHHTFVDTHTHTHTLTHVHLRFPTCHTHTRCKHVHKWCGLWARRMIHLVSVYLEAPRALSAPRCANPAWQVAYSIIYHCWWW